MNAQELILTNVLKCRRMDLYLNRPELSPEQDVKFKELTRRFEAGEPVQYLIGECEFYGLDFAVDERVLIPRPETEVLVEEVIKTFAQDLGPIHIVDLGTGSGNIAVALAKHIPSAHVTAVDYSREILSLALENARRNDVDSKIEFVYSDIFAGFNKMFRGKSFDALVSNPPYIPTEQLNSLPLIVQKEPAKALDGGVDGLDFYRCIENKSYAFLKRGGKIFLEIGDDQTDAIAEIFRTQNGWREVKFLPDYSGRTRIFKAIKHF